MAFSLQLLLERDLCYAKYKYSINLVFLPLRPSRKARRENVFAGVKRYAAVSAVYRNLTEDFDENLMTHGSWIMELILDGSMNNASPGFLTILP